MCSHGLAGILCSATASLRQVLRQRVVDGLRRELAGLDQLHHLRGEVADGLDVDRRQAHGTEERLQPPLTGRAVPVARDLSGTVVAPPPGVEVLGDGLAGAPELAALGTDLHPRAELRRRARAGESALLALAPVAVAVQGPVEGAAPGRGLPVHAGILASSHAGLLALAAETACRLLPKSCHTD